jgi:hypothetical protein
VKCIRLSIGCFEGDNEHLGYVKGTQFLEQMVNCYNLKMFAPWFLKRNV